MSRIEAMLRRWERRPDEAAIVVLIVLSWGLAAAAVGVAVVALT